MSKIYRLKKSFTAGEIGSILNVRVDNDRYKNGCTVMRNMVVKSQGPTTRRSGTKFIYDLTSLLTEGITDVKPRMIPFVFDELHAYVLVFYKHSTGTTRVVFATQEGLVVDPIAPTNPYVFEFSGTVDIQNFDYAQSADFLYVVQEIRTQLIFKRLAADSWTAEDVLFSTRPFVMNKIPTLTVTPSSTTGTITLTASSALFNDTFVGTELELNGGKVLITSFTDATHVTATSVTNLVNTTATAQWSTPDWGPVQGYPRKVGFYEQRICFASTKVRPQTVWFSQSGDYNNFGVSTPLVASDACTFTFDSATQNKIQWVNSARQFLVGTLGDEWTLSGAGSDPLSYASVRAARHTNSGGETLKPLMIGQVTLFVERLGRRVNQFTYDYYSDSYTTVDLSILSPHLTDDYSIISWAYQQTPNGIVWCVREDGVLLGLTFKREHNVTGWHRHDTDGRFLTVAAIPGVRRETEIWTIVERDFSEGPRWYIEKLEVEFRSSDVRDSRFLDCHRVYDGVPVTLVTGLEFLEGKTVKILADGAVHPPRTVTSGNIVLERSASRIVVGLPFDSEVRPTFDELQLRDGSSISREQRITVIDIFFKDTVGCEYGRIGKDGTEYIEELPFRMPWDTPGTPLPLFTGVKRIQMQEGWDEIPDVIIRQTDPLPLTILGLVDHISATE